MRTIEDISAVIYLPKHSINLREKEKMSFMNHRLVRFLLRIKLKFVFAALGITVAPERLFPLMKRQN